MTTPLQDQAARDRIRIETGSSLFVEAGAGSGKTKSLVDRVTTLVMVNRVPLRKIAAVTFTEKAGAELRDRLRAEFEKTWRDEFLVPTQRDWAGEALDDLDSAAIGTLHSFAQRLLAMHPIEAGLPPLVEVLDEVASSVAFEERWSVLQRQLLDDAEVADKVLLALSANVKLDQLRSLTRAFGADWDLIEERVIFPGSPDVSLPDVIRLAKEATALAARASECANRDDRFLPSLVKLDAWATKLAAATDQREQYAVLLAAGALKFTYGQQGNWGGGLDGLKNSCKDIQEQAAKAAAAFTEATLRPLAYWIAERVLESARARAADGRLEFHDLLVLARDLLRRNADVRAALQDAFPRLLLDEFQDTDPIQIELAVRIAGGREAGAEDWRDVQVPPGSLFVVGDPKQSIYRFRRANIAEYLGAQAWFGSDAQVKLTTNFRTVNPVLAWVNEVFAEVIGFVEGAQPHYEPLACFREEPATGPAVTVLGRDEHPFKAHGNAEVLRIREAADVAAAIRQATSERWTVEDPKTGQWREIELGDIAILIPARTSLDLLEDALDGAGIPFRAESSSLVYHSPEVRDLMLAARAVADPADQFSCVMALRSPLFGCGDDDLWAWKQARGSFTLTAPTEQVVERLPGGLHPVAEAMDYLRRLHYQSRWMTPSEVLGAIVADRRMLEVASSGPRAQDQWRRLRFVLDQARAWSEVEHGGLRSYLVWAAKQGEDSSRVAEAVLPETDVDAVRIMTIHSAKGLEFPMVVLSGMTSAPRRQSGVRLLWKPDGYAVSITKAMQTNDFQDVAPIDEQMDSHERRRLLYVATTRARDHLVVSLHRGEGGAETNAKVLATAGASTAAGAVAFDAQPSIEPVETGGRSSSTSTFHRGARDDTARRSAALSTPSCRPSTSHPRRVWRTRSRPSVSARESWRTPTT